MELQHRSRIQQRRIQPPRNRHFHRTHLSSCSPHYHLPRSAASPAFAAMSKEKKSGGPPLPPLPSGEVAFAHDFSAAVFKTIAVDEAMLGALCEGTR
jgi:hypothetical protein